MSITFKVIVALDCKNGIGKEGKIPWHKLQEDMKMFKKKTKKQHYQNIVIMGRKTWESIGSKPLTERFNIILSKNKNWLLLENDKAAHGGFLCCESLIEALDYVERVYHLKNDNLNVVIIGGQEVYQQAIQMPNCSRIYVTRINGDFNCDTHFPNIGKEYQLSIKQPIKRFIDRDIHYEFEKYSRTFHFFTHLVEKQEGQYIGCLIDVLNQGEERQDRTGTGTISLFGKTMTFDLQHYFPLITTKRVFWKGVVCELLWMLSGSTDSNVLSNNGVKIWDANSQREILDNLGLTHLQEGDLGPIYGHTWRHYGAPYLGCKADYTGQGIDQIARIVDLIKNNPTSRRIILSSWDPSTVDQVALPPCHVLAQFYVCKYKKLSCQMYQRSADMGLGVPFNIASYALLTYMLAHVCGLEPGIFIYNIGDAHIYKNHIDAISDQICRSPRAFPKLYLNRNVVNIFDFTFDDFVLVGYYPRSEPVVMKMAV